MHLMYVYSSKGIATGKAAGRPVWRRRTREVRVDEKPKILQPKVPKTHDFRIQMIFIRETNIRNISKIRFYFCN